MTVHRARVLAAVLVSISALVPGTRLHGQQPLDQLPLDELRALAEQGDVNAQFNVGVRHSTGHGAVQDDAEAVRWWRRAAEQGHVDAQGSLGDAYLFGCGVEQDYTEAAQWYRLAADRGDVEAQFELGRMTVNGLGVAQDDAEAVAWWQLAADQGYVAAQLHLGFAYETGRGVQQNDADAERWYRAAAEGDREDPALHYARGVNFSGTDEPEALTWFRLAAEQGHAGAQFELGVMYYEGGTVAQNFSWAARWFGLAADQGDAPAQDRLGLMYRFGVGVQMYFGEALRWFRVSAEQSIKTAWRLTCARATIAGLHFHDLWREAASRLLEGDVPEHYVQEVLGHANLSTTSRYLATTRQGLHQAMQRYEARVQTRANLSETRGSQRPSPAEERDTKAPETGLDRDPA